MILKYKNFFESGWERNGILEAVTLFFVFYLSSYLYQGAAPSPESFNDLRFHISYYFYALPQILLLLLMIQRRFSSLKPAGLDKFRLKDLLSSFYVLVLLFISLFAASTLTSLLSGVLPTGGDVIPWRFTNYKIIPLLLLTCLITGYTEEIFFRGYLLSLLEKEGAGKIPALLISSLLFSAGHGYEGLPGILFSFLSGVILSLLFYSKRNLHSLSLGHGLYNFLSLLLISSLLLPGF